MKIKTISFLSGLFALFILSSGFINTKEVPQNLDGGKVSFAEFLSHFEKVEMPFEINLDNKYKYDNKKANHLVALKKTKSKKSRSTNNRQTMKDYIPELKSGMFKRSGPPEVLPVARFYPNDKMVAVIYMTYQPFRDVKMSGYSLTLYDLKGKLIQKRDVEDEAFDFDRSGFSLAYNTYRKTETFSIDEKGQIWKKTYTNLWKDDIKSKGIEDNEIIGYDLKDTQVFQIQSNGLVETSKSYDVDDRASLD